ncbi:MAG: alpha/beta hydrolase-fold protein [Acidobacteriota bacterium]|nr:alpha/beta hydrolase-fold protein [Acidobacteriota bacterium]
MLREYHRWFSPRLGRDMELLTFGHAGVPFLVFPSSMGSFHEYEDRGMVGALSDKLEHGHLQLFCLSTVDSESFYNDHAHPRHRVERARQYEGYVFDEVIPFVRQRNTSPETGTTGCSFGAYHALQFALRRPDVIHRCVTMGGAYDMKRFLNGYYDDECYFLNPVDYLPNLSDEWLLGALRHNKWVLATGDRDICLRDNEHMAGVLRSKGVPVHLHVWNNSEHDWPAWLDMAKAYLP